MPVRNAAETAATETKGVIYGGRILILETIIGDSKTAYTCRLLINGSAGLKADLAGRWYRAWKGVINVSGRTVGVEMVAVILGPYHYF